MRFFKKVLLLTLVVCTGLSVSACITMPDFTNTAATGSSNQDLEALKKRGWTNYKAADYTLAAQTFRAALSLNENDAEARLGLAESQLKLSQLEDALQNYQRVAAVLEYTTPALQGIGLTELQRGNLSVAEKALTTAVEGDDSLWRAWNGLAKIYDLDNDWEQADFAYNKALQYSPDKYIVYNNMGVSYMAQGLYEEAEMSFAEALRYDPSSEAARTNQKLALAMQNKYAEATLEGDEYKRAKALNNTGYAAMLQGRYDEAEKLFIKAIEVSPSFYKAAYKNLQILHQMKKGK